MLNKSIASGIVFLSISSLFTLDAMAQDIIHRKNGKKMETKIIEIGSNEIKYKDFNYQDGPTYTIEKNNISQIVFQNGRIEKYDTKYYDNEDTEWYLDNRKNAIKFNLLGPMMGFAEIAYERNIKVGQSYEVSIGGIGIGKNLMLQDYSWDPTQGKSIYTDQRGAFVSAGYKFSNMPSFIFFGKPRQKHLFHGTYIKPILYLGHYSENQLVYDMSGLYSIQRQNVTFGSLNFEMGKQWEFSNRMLFNAYLSLGYAFDNKKEEYVDDNNRIISDYANNYVINRTGKKPGLGIAVGFKVGYLFDYNKDKK